MIKKTVDFFWLIFGTIFYLFAGVFIFIYASVANLFDKEK